MKKILVICSCLFVAIAAQAQEDKHLSFGLVFDKSNDPTDEMGLGQLNGKYSAKRENLGLEVLYDITSKWRMKNIVGVTFCNSDFGLSAPQSEMPMGEMLSEMQLSLSHAVLYNLWGWQTEDRNLRLSLNPYLELRYGHTLKGAGEKSNNGSGDLTSAETAQWVEANNLPAVNSRTKMPAYSLAATAGLQAELVFFKHFGVFYAIGYNQSLTGHSRIDLDYIYKSNAPGYVGRSSKDAGLNHSFGLRWYIK
ncbi:MAG: hypothetical protein LBS05_01915 [Tannerellaceae bacterium]|jgi:hypothetical protein|nr:hypothetical protein [Tannerellaceae bacterium]